MICFKNELLLDVIVRAQMIVGGRGLKLKVKKRYAPRICFNFK